MAYPLELLYAQVVKSYRRRRLVAVKHRVVFGTMERVQQVLAVCGWQINTAFVERLNLDIRQRVAAIVDTMLPPVPRNVLSCGRGQVQARSY